MSSGPGAARGNLANKARSFSNFLLTILVICDINIRQTNGTGATCLKCLRLMQYRAPRCSLWNMIPSIKMPLAQANDIGLIGALGSLSGFVVSHDTSRAESLQ